MTSPLLTHSRLACFKTCNWKHYLAYELGLRKTVSSEALRMGSAFHKCAELVALGRELEAAISEALAAYEEVPNSVPPEQWSLEREKVYRLMHAYYHVYKDDGLEVVAAELPFDLPLHVPGTSEPFPDADGSDEKAGRFRIAGKIDRIVRRPLFPDQMYVLETKTTSRDISPTASYWQRLTIDSQITRYMYAARRMGYPVVGVIYDVIRKPEIYPAQVAAKDEQGRKIVLDQDGKRVFKKDGEPRQTGSEKDGYTVQTALETIEEYGDRLSQDICDRPSFYFQRKEIARLDSDLDQFERELWDDARTLDFHQQANIWTKNTGACMSPYRCEYAVLCFQGWTPEQPTPDGFQYVTDVHPELSEEE